MNLAQIFTVCDRERLAITTWECILVFFWKCSWNLKAGMEKKMKLLKLLFLNHVMIINTQPRF